MVENYEKSKKMGKVISKLVSSKSSHVTVIARNKQTEIVS